MNNNNYKPSVGYEGFIGEFEEQMSNERDRILNNYDISPEDLENKLIGQVVTMKYPKYWTPLDWNNSIRHISKLEFRDKVLFNELAD